MKIILFLFLFLVSFSFNQPSFISVAKADSDLVDIEGVDFNDEDFEEDDDEEEEEEEEEEESEVSAEDLDRELVDDDDLERELVDEGEDEELEAELLEEEESPKDKEGKKEDNDAESKKEAKEEEEPKPQEITPSETPSVTEEDSSVDKSFEEEIEEFDVEEEASEPIAEDLESAEESLELVEESPSGQEVNVITNITYLSDSDEIVIEGSNVISHQHKANIENQQFIIEILESRLTKNLKWPYVLRDFNTNFGLIQADQKEDNTVRIIIQLKEKSNFPMVRVDDTGQKLIVYFNESGSSSNSDQSDGSVKLTEKTLPHPRSLSDLFSGNVNFSGSPISFHVIDAPVKQVLRFISEESGLNMVIDDNVKGNVTLKLESIPWDQALHTIFKVKGLGYTREGNVITISPLDIMEQRAKKLREIVANQKPLTPILTKIIPIAYGQIADMEDKVKTFLTKGNQVTGQRAGQVIVHKETNTLIIIDTDEVIKRVETLVSYLDKTPKQVMVEARIIEASESLARNFGLEWSLNGNLPITINPLGIAETIQNISGSYLGKSSSTGGDFNLNLSGIPIIGDVGASLNIAEINGYVRVVSSPKIVTISGKQASITRNQPIQILKTKTVTQQATGGQTDSETFENVDVEIKLDVTPVVTSANTIFLKVNISRSNPGVGRTVQTTREAKTEVLVKDGHTIVIGGIYQYDQSHRRRGIPFFKHIPFLKYLFDQKESSSAKNELLVFLTPKIINVND